MKILSFIICLLCCAILLPAQPGKMLEAVRLHCYPEIDGHLNDSCWQRLSALEEFTTSTPVFGETPQCRTEVRLFYTETALYVAAHCYDPDAGGVRRDGGIRDGELTGDWFQVSIDTWNDDRLSFDFTVSAAGIQQDLRDETAWDANWQSAVTLQAGGWTLEMRIPYTALRYPRITEQNWGIQFTRFDRSLGETSTWSPQNPLVQDRVLQFGSLTGLQNIHQEQRHALAIHTNTAYQSPGIFVNSNGLTQSAGIDARLGLSESATLDVTVLPPISVTKSFGSLSFPGDDGLNISGNAPLPAPRQLLAEESGLFQRGAGSLEPNPVISPFQLSRRRPLNPGTFFTGIHESKLLNAVKFTGRTKGNWRVGAYHATLGPVKAEVTNFLSSSSISRETITYQNLSAYNYLSAEYIFPNNSYARVSNAAMLAGRDMNTFLPGADFRLRNHANTLEISGNALMTLQTADTARWQGYAYNLALSRINRRWGWSVAHEARSPEYSPFLLAPLPLNSFRGSSSNAFVNYRDFQPRGPWLNRGARLGLSTFWSVRPGEQNVWTIVSTFHALDRRFRRFTLGASLTPHNQIFRYENGGANLSQKVAPRAGLQLGFITDTRRRFSVSNTLGAQIHLEGKFPAFQDSFSVSWVISRRLSLGARATVNAQLQQLFLLSTPNLWVFEQRDQWIGEGVLELNCYMHPRLRAFGWAGMYYQRFTNRGAVVFDGDGSLTPITHPTGAGPESYSDWHGELGLQYVMSPLRQIRLRHRFSPNYLTVTTPPGAFPVTESVGNLTQLEIIFTLGGGGKAPKGTL